MASINVTALTSVSFVEANGVKVFYRHAGSPSAPVILLLHGFPSSSTMFRNLIPLLAQKYRVVAPDLPGFGFTTFPEGYKHTFANLATTTGAFLDKLGIERFVAYIFDYGAPTLFRLALQRPDAVAAIVSQNGNAYDEGLGKDFWKPLTVVWKSGMKAEDRESLRKGLLTMEATRWQYEFGARKPDEIPPEAYYLDQALLDRPGGVETQLDLFMDYRTNVELYPQFQAYLRDSGVPVLAAWGKHDVIFVKEGAEAFERDVKPEMFEKHWIEAGHFALETNEGQMAQWIDGFITEKKVFGKK